MLVALLTTPNPPHRLALYLFILVQSPFIESLVCVDPDHGCPGKVLCAPCCERCGIRYVVNYFMYYILSSTVAP